MVIANTLLTFLVRSLLILLLHTFAFSEPLLAQNLCESYLNGVPKSLRESPRISLKRMYRLPQKHQVKPGSEGQLIFENREGAVVAETQIGPIEFVKRYNLEHEGTYFVVGNSRAVEIAEVSDEGVRILPYTSAPKELVNAISKQSSQPPLLYLTIADVFGDPPDKMYATYTFENIYGEVEGSYHINQKQIATLLDTLRPHPSEELVAEDLKGATLLSRYPHSTSPLTSFLEANHPPLILSPEETVRQSLQRSVQLPGNHQVTPGNSGSLLFKNSNGQLVARTGIGPITFSERYNLDLPKPLTYFIVGNSETVNVVEVSAKNVKIFHYTKAPLRLVRAIEAQSVVPTISNIEFLRVTPLRNNKYSISIGYNNMDGPVFESQTLRNEQMNAILHLLKVNTPEELVGQEAALINPLSLLQ